MKGAIFDLDGVITDTAKFHFEAWSQLAKEQLGLVLPAEFEAELKGISRTDSLIKILEFGGYVITILKQRSWRWPKRKMVIICKRSKL